jgi:hypothetical protein
MKAPLAGLHGRARSPAQLPMLAVPAKRAPCPHPQA